MRPITEEEQERIWDLHQAGVPVKRIARMMGRQNCSMRELISRTGGIRPRARVINERHLVLAEREEISRGLAAGLSLRAIAHELGRAPSTVAREVNANGGRSGYRALVAERAARRRAPEARVHAPPTSALPQPSCTVLAKLSDTNVAPTRLPKASAP